MGREKMQLEEKAHALTLLEKAEFVIVVAKGHRRRLKGIHSRPDTNRTGAEGLSFYYPRLLHFY